MDTDLCPEEPLKHFWTGSFDLRGRTKQESQLVMMHSWGPGRGRKRNRDREAGIDHLRNLFIYFGLTKLIFITLLQPCIMWLHLGRPLFLQKQFLLMHSFFFLAIWLDFLHFILSPYDCLIKYWLLIPRGTIVSILSKLFAASILSRDGKVKLGDILTSLFIGLRQTRLSVM